MSSPSSPSAGIDELEDCPSEVPINEGLLSAKEAIPPDYERLSFVIENDLDAATEEWSLKEETAGRRLVRFRRSVLGSNVRLTWETHPPTYLCGPKEVVISCMKLPELGGHFVTSFDIVKLAEYILNLDLNTDMKNRARRNMASISCNTLEKISATEASPTNDFVAVMRFENPKPRSIEKSIKVYHWSLLPLCLTKILQRFVSLSSSSLPHTTNKANHRSFIFLIFQLDQQDSSISLKRQTNGRGASETTTSPILADLPKLAASPRYTYQSTVNLYAASVYLNQLKPLIHQLR